MTTEKEEDFFQIGKLYVSCLRANVHLKHDMKFIKENDEITAIYKIGTSYMAYKDIIAVLEICEYNHSAPIYKNGGAGALYRNKDRAAVALKIITNKGDQGWVFAIRKPPPSIDDQWSFERIY